MSDPATAPAGTTDVSAQVAAIGKDQIALETDLARLRADATSAATVVSSQLKTIVSQWWNRRILNSVVAEHTPSFNYLQSVLPELVEAISKGA
jgi:hypothetical protein